MHDLKYLTDINRHSLLLPPHSPENLQREIQNFIAHCLPNSVGHLAITSSGTTGKKFKGYIFTKEAIFANALSVNQHLDLSRKDQWGIGLPHHLIAGASIFFRSQLLYKDPIFMPLQDTPSWLKILVNEKISVTSLIPKQLYHLVHFLKISKLKLPSSLRFLLIGGDTLYQKLHEDALELNIPVLRTYSMTEAGPQIACEKIPLNGLELLTIVQVKTSQNHLLIKTPSLFSYQFEWDLAQQKLNMQPVENFLDDEDFFRTSDLVEINKNKIEFLGRQDGVIKKRGLLFSLHEAKKIIQNYAYTNGYWGNMELLLQAIDPSLHQGESYQLKLLISQELQQQLPKIQSDLRDELYPHKIDIFQVKPIIEHNEMGKTLWNQ